MGCSLIRLELLVESFKFRQPLPFYRTPLGWPVSVASIGLISGNLQSMQFVTPIELLDFTSPLIHLAHPGTGWVKKKRETIYSQLNGPFRTAFL